MTVIDRQKQIFNLLNDTPISAKKLAARFHVSRQVIVQDIAVLRASNKNIIATCRGYILSKEQRRITPMTVKEVQDEILRQKQEKDICILAHAYQSQAILEIADYIGDSYGLSVAASKTKNKNIIMCGVRFMAETCKILCPDKNVFLPNPVVGCPMAEQMDLQTLYELKNQYPDYTVVAYINTTASLKTACDVCVTSASAVEICKNIQNDKILFIPDPNLGKYVQKHIKDKHFVFFDGGCPYHKKTTEEDVKKAKQKHPNALLLVHPECSEEVANLADFVGSTTAIMDFVKNSDANEFIIGTENSIVEHLQYNDNKKKFYPLAANLTCPDMRITSLMDIYHCINGTGGEEIILSEDTMMNAAKCIHRMIEINP